MKEKQLYAPKKSQEKKEFFDGSKKNIYMLFDKPDQQTVDFFVSNTDHGLEHEYNVYQKAIQITESYEKHTGKTLRKNLIYIMAILHDSMRSIKYDISDPQKNRKEKRNDKNHEKYGAFLFDKLLIKAEEKGINISISENEKKDIKEYLINHDYFSNQLNGKRYLEPSSKEGQIVRLADRISIPLQNEIQRYRDTGKRLGTKFFHEDISFTERENFSFDNMSEDFKSGKVDEVMFFVALLMITEKDFSDPILGDIYKQRALQKHDAANFIMQIADKENVSIQQKQKLTELLKHLGKKFGFIL